jgi:catechol 1,2-dioxygenase
MSTKEVRTPPSPTIDRSRIVPRAVELVEAFQKAFAEVVREHDITQDEYEVAANAVEAMMKGSGAPLSLALLPLAGNVFQRKEGHYTTTDLPGPMYLEGAPVIANPGVLPMRPDEPGVPLFVSGYVRSGDGVPLAQAEVHLWLAANDTDMYSSMGLDDQPPWNLRARQMTDSAGHYEFRTITPKPYVLSPLPIVYDAAAALGRSPYRAAHVHFAMRHPDLVQDFAGEIYFKGDPFIECDALSPGFATPDLQVELCYHDDPAEIAERGMDVPFNTVTYDFTLKTKADTGQ